MKGFSNNFAEGIIKRIISGTIADKNKSSMTELKPAFCTSSSGTLFCHQFTHKKGRNK